MIAPSADVYGMLANSRAPGEGFVERDTGLLVNGVPVRQALDAEGLPLLLLPINEPIGEMANTSGRALGISCTQGNLILRCLDPRLTTQFWFLVDDMLREVEATPSPTIDSYSRVLDNWRSLFSSADSAVLSLAQQIGLLAELRLLEQALRVYPSALARWSGPLGGRHDFQGDRASIEAKSTMKHHDFNVAIHGFWQLEPPLGSSLYLYAERVERTASGSGESLPSIVARVHDLLSNHAEFSGLLAKSGYDERRHDTYADFRFELLEQRLCKVDSTFPRLAPHAIGEDIVSLIPEVQYSVNVGAVTAIATGVKSVEVAVSHLLAADA